MAYLKVAQAVPPVRFVSLLAMTYFISCLAFAQTQATQTQPIHIDVDASEATRRLLRTSMKFPVTPGPLSLLYPKWIPGEHGPTGPIEDLVGIRVTGNGSPIPWNRDAVDMYEIHLTIPPGVSTIDVEAQFISPPESGGFSSGGSITSQLAVLSWNQLLLYPKGTPSDQLNYQATLKVPNGWRYGTALPIASESGNQILFKPSSLTTLIDSPVQTGANFRTIDLNPGGAVPTWLHIAADSDRATRITPEETEHYSNLVREATTLFGGHHYRDYHFLYTLSDHVAHFGLEHHESSDDRTDEDALVEDGNRRLAAGLLPHEFVHSWNGKYRRPAGLATGDYDQPMKGNLLWVFSIPLPVKRRRSIKKSDAHGVRSKIPRWLRRFSTIHARTISICAAASIITKKERSSGSTPMLRSGRSATARNRSTISANSGQAVTACRR
jgi:predicted metalloprotease with PDZ domain